MQLIAVQSRMSGKTKKPSPQNIKARLEYGATESSIVIVNGSVYTQNEIASMPNATAKMSTII